MESASYNALTAVILRCRSHQEPRRDSPLATMARGDEIVNTPFSTASTSGGQGDFYQPTRYSKQTRPDPRQGPSRSATEVAPSETGQSAVAPRRHKSDEPSAVEVNQILRRSLASSPILPISPKPGETATGEALDLRVNQTPRRAAVASAVAPMSPKLERTAPDEPLASCEMQRASRRPPAASPGDARVALEVQQISRRPLAGTLGVPLSPQPEVTAAVSESKEGDSPDLLHAIETAQVTYEEMLYLTTSYFRLKSDPRFKRRLDRLLATEEEPVVDCPQTPPQEETGEILNLPLRPPTRIPLMVSSAHSHHLQRGNPQRLLTTNENQQAGGSQNAGESSQHVVPLNVPRKKGTGSVSGPTTRESSCQVREVENRYGVAGGGPGGSHSTPSAPAAPQRGISEKEIRSNDDDDEEEERADFSLSAQTYRSPSSAYDSSWATIELASHVAPGWSLCGVNRSMLRGPGVSRTVLRSVYVSPVSRPQGGPCKYCALLLTHVAHVTCYCMAVVDVSCVTVILLVLHLSFVVRQTSYARDRLVWCRLKALFKGNVRRICYFFLDTPLRSSIVQGFT